MQDQTLTCKECNKDFVWTASEQEFYASKGFSAPLRCAECRAKAKAAKQAGQMPRGPRQMHEITCANCGSKGEVPFEPRDPSNVLCADCFRNKRDAERGGMPAPVATPATDDMASDAGASDDSMSMDDSASTDDTNSSDESNA